MKIKYEYLKREFEKLSSKTRWELIEPYLVGDSFVGHPTKPIGFASNPISPCLALQKVIMLKENLYFEKTRGTSSSICFTGEGHSIKDTSVIYTMKLVILKKDWKQIINNLGYKSVDLDYVNINSCASLLRRKLVLDCEELD